MNRFPLILLSLALFLFSACGHKQPGMFGRQHENTDTAVASRKLFLVKQNGKWGYINREGQIAIEPQFDDGREFSEGLAPVGFGSYGQTKWGYINTLGQIVIEPAFEEAYNFSEGLALIRLNGKCGYLNAAGEMVIEPQFGFSQPFSEGFALVTIPAKAIGPITLRSSKMFFIDKQGHKLGNLDFTDGRSFSEGLASVSVDGKSGCIDTAGEFVIPPQFDLLENFSEGLAPVQVQGEEGTLWGYIDKSGQIAIKPSYEEAHQFSEGLAAVKINGSFSYIDKSGKEIVKTPYNLAGEFSEGIARVNGKVGIYGYHGFIDKGGQVIVEPRFSFAKDFSHGLAMVEIGGLGLPPYDVKYGYVDRTGKLIWPPTN